MVCMSSKATTGANGFMAQTNSTEGLDVNPRRGRCGVTSLVAQQHSAETHFLFRPKRLCFRKVRSTVSKSALGRGLGNLMKEPRHAPLPGELAAKPVSITPGVASLLRGTNGSPQSELPPPPPQAPSTILPSLEPLVGKRLL